MHKEKIYAYICILLISLLPAVANAKDKTTGEENLIADNAALFGGVAVSADFVGFSMKLLDSKFANMEVAGRLNFLEKYFPIVELGIGDCTKTGSENDNTLSVTSPYFRVGMDYNFNRKMNGNRLFGGVRYGYSSYNYDFHIDELRDIYYGTIETLDLNDLNGKNQWLELVVGVETKLWSIVRLGWSLRYKYKIKQKASEYGAPWFVPGFGKNGTTTFGGTVNLTFDIGKSARKSMK